MVVGKTNLDQFATGLVGTRSPYGTPVNPFDSLIVPGGSSSGSGVAVAAGLVPFALGTDTAGSGRIPAALGNIVGCKPSLGLVSTVGVVPACRSLDCVSVFALTAHDAALVLGVLDHRDANDIYARASGQRRQRASASAADVVIGVPDDSVISTCDTVIADAFARQLDELAKLGVTFVTVDMAPFLAAGALLYDGPWLAERHAAVGRFIEQHPDEIHPITRSIISDAGRFDASDAFTAEYRRRELVRASASTWSGVDAIVVPSLPTIPTLDDVAADPIGVNARLGKFSTFVNLLDLCAVAVPGGLLPTGVPVGFTLIAPALSDLFLLTLADQYQQMVDRPLGALAADVGIAHTDLRVPRQCGRRHCDDRPVGGGRRPPQRPAAERSAGVAWSDAWPPARRPPPAIAWWRSRTRCHPSPVCSASPSGAAIEVEVWDVPVAEFGSFVAGVPAPLAIGKLELADGSWVSGFVCESVGLDGADDITPLRWLARLSGQPLLEQDPLGLHDAGTVGTEHDQPHGSGCERFEHEPPEPVGRCRVHRIGADEFDRGLRRRHQLADETTGAVLDDHHLDLHTGSPEGDLPIGVLRPDTREFTSGVEHHLGEFGVDRAPGERRPRPVEDVVRDRVVGGKRLGDQAHEFVVGHEVELVVRMVGRRVIRVIVPRLVHSAVSFRGGRGDLSSSPGESSLRSFASARSRLGPMLPMGRPTISAIVA